MEAGIQRYSVGADAPKFYLERAVNALRNQGQGVGETLLQYLLQYLSPLGWEHINLTGDYVWRSSANKLSR